MSITTMTFVARDFSARRGASDEHTLHGSVRSDQRSLAEKEPPPEGLRRIWPVAALLVGHRSTSGYAPSSRLATGRIRRNERHCNYVHDHLAEKDQPQHKREQGRQARIDQDRHKQRDFQARQKPVAETRQEDADDEANEPRRKERADDVESGRSGAP